MAKKNLELLLHKQKLIIDMINKIAFFDLETTGTDVKKDQIIQIAIVAKSWPELELIHVFKTNVKPTFALIKPEASAVHGIYSKDVANSPKFTDIASKILEAIEGCAIAGFNSNAFDVPLLLNEFDRVPNIKWDWTQHPLIDVGNIFKRKEERTLSAAAKWYLNKEHTGAHDAGADTLVTAEIFEEQLNRYDLPKDLAQLEIYSNFDKKRLDLSGVFYYGEDNEIYIGIGSSKGKRAKDDLGFVGWIYKNNFPSDVHEVCKQILGYK